MSGEHSDDQTGLGRGWICEAMVAPENKCHMKTNSQPSPGPLPFPQIIYSLVMLLVLLLGDTRLLSSMATCRLPGGLPL